MGVTPRLLAALAMAVLLAAHVGSPDVYSRGTAGPYTIDVAIRPPSGLKLTLVT